MATGETSVSPTIFQFQINLIISKLKLRTIKYNSLKKGMMTFVVCLSFQCLFAIFYNQSWTKVKLDWLPVNSWFYPNI